jgi:signal recognition particle receptor subunit beta
LGVSQGFDPCGRDIVVESTPLCRSKTEAINRLSKLTSSPSYIVDAADKKALPIAKEELHALLEKPVLDGIPLLVLGNKSDLPEKLTVDELIDALNLKAVSHREVSCYGISAKEETNLDAVLQWLIKRSTK